MRYRRGDRSERSARVFRQPAAGDDRGDRTLGTGRRANSYRAGCRIGARRLSIVDLAGGRQPISNEDGSIWVTQNGEIFEYPELQTELVARGHRLATRCDTELWAHLYEDLGEGFFEKARGQYAVALWDRKNQKVVLGRDRVGICPLYYTLADGWLLWGSEIKALLASGLVDAGPTRKGSTSSSTRSARAHRGRFSKAYMNGSLRRVKPWHWNTNSFASKEVISRKQILCCWMLWPTPMPPEHRLLSKA